MKRIAKISAIVLSLAMIAAAFSACNGGGKVSKTSDTSSATESSKTESSKTESSKTESSKTESSKTESSKTENSIIESISWKDLYKDRLNQSDILDSYQFALIDLNGDEIPELFVDRITQAEGGTLFYVLGEAVQEFPLETAFAYAAGTGEFMTDYGIMGARSVCGFKFDGSSVTKTEEGESNENEQLPQPEYKWNGSDVTKEEFDQNVAALQANKVTPGTVDKANIILSIENY